MNIKKETKAYWGDKFIEILDPHKPGHIIRVYPDYWDEKAPIREQGEPVAWIEHHKGGDNLVWDNPGGKCSPLYTKPQQRKPLTDEQIVAIVREASRGSAIRREGSTSMRIARAIEAAHGIKE